MILISSQMRLKVYQLQEFFLGLLEVVFMFVSLYNLAGQNMTLQIHNHFIAMCKIKY